MSEYEKEIKYWLKFNSRLSFFLFFPVFSGFITFILFGYFIDMFLLSYGGEILYFYFLLIKKEKIGKRLEKLSLKDIKQEREIIILRSTSLHPSSMAQSKNSNSKPLQENGF